MTDSIILLYHDYRIQQIHGHWVFWHPRRTRVEFQGEGKDYRDCCAQIDVLRQAPARISRVSP